MRQFHDIVNDVHIFFGVNLINEARTNGDIGRTELWPEIDDSHHLDERGALHLPDHFHVRLADALTLILAV
jgi:hypothetical protein